MSKESSSLPEIHVTGLSTFKQCRRKYYFSHIGNLQPKGARHAALSLGTSFHAGVAEYYRWRWLDVKTRDSFTASELMGAEVLMNTWAEELPLDIVEAEFGEDMQKYHDNTELLKSMYNIYIPWCENHDDWDEVIAVEQPLKVEMHNAVLVGTPDLLVRIDDKIWVVDHKTCKSFKDEDDLILDDQMGVYSWMLKQIYGEFGGGIIYSQIRKKVPSKPALIKSGKRLSKQKSDTTYELLLAAIAEHNFDPRDYLEELAQAKLNEFVRRLYIPFLHGLYGLEVIESTLIATINDIVTADSDCYYSTPNFMCRNFCPFFTLCRILATDGDTEVAINELYEQRPIHEEATKNES